MEYLQLNTNIGFIATVYELETNREYMYQEIEDLVKMNYCIIDIEISKESKQEIINVNDYNIVETE